MAPTTPKDADTGGETDGDTAEDAGTDATDETQEVETTTAEGDDSGKAQEDEGKSAEENSLLSQRSKAQRPWRKYLRRSIMPLLLVISLAVSGFLGWQQWQAHRLHQAGDQAREAAIAYAGVLTSTDSTDPKKLDENFRQALDGATGKWKDEYTQSSVRLRQLLIDNKATAHGVVVDSAIASESLNKVVVLLFIDQTVTNMQMPDPRIDRSRIKMTMEKVDGRWRASDVQLL